jgi:hypothetical protein
VLPRHERTHRSHRIATVRDVVEVVAILAAGIWAFYVFIYENRIVPSQAQPNVNFSASLQRVSQHNGLIGVRLDTEVRNSGTVKAHFLGIATAVVGQRIEPVSSPKSLASYVDTQQYAPYFRESKDVVVFEVGYVTNLGNPKVSTDLPLEPGADVRNERIFYVPIGAFDRLRVYVVALFTRNDEKTIPTRIYVGKDGLPDFKSASRADVDTTSTYLTSLDLNGR